MGYSKKQRDKRRQLRDQGIVPLSKAQLKKVSKGEGVTLLPGQLLPTKGAGIQENGGRGDTSQKSENEEKSEIYKNEENKTTYKNEENKITARNLKLDKTIAGRIIKSYINNKSRIKPRAITGGFILGQDTPLSYFDYERDREKNDAQRVLEKIRRKGNNCFWQSDHVWKSKKVIQTGKKQRKTIQTFQTL